MQETSQEVVGFYPVKEEYHQTLQDRILTGKLTFFEHGLIYADMRLGAFVLPYSAIERVTMHGNTNDKHDWMQFVLNDQGKNLVPLGHVAEPTFFLLVKHQFANDTILKLQKLTDDLEIAQVKARNQRRKDKEEQRRRVSSTSTQQRPAA